MIINIRKSSIEEKDTCFNFLDDNHCAEFMLCAGIDGKNNFAMILDEKHTLELYNKLKEILKK